ncbi:MAG: Tc toxin subunit A [Pseudomonas sp.]
MTSQESAVTPNTYAKLFPEQLSNTCSPEAPEANCGPIAYLSALYQQALSLEASSTASDRLLLKQRRPDIGELLLDPQTLEQPLPALTLAIRALTRQAQGHAGADVYLPEHLANSGQHAGLPFHYAQEQIKAVLKQRQVPHFELLQKAEYSYPNFCNGRLRTPELRQVMRNASGFSPALQALLLTDKPEKNTVNGWRAWYGYAETVPGTQAISELLEVETYCQRTGISTEQLLEMLAISGIDDNANAGFSAVRTSSAYRPTGKPPLEDYHHGTAYINTNKSKRLTVKDAQAEVGIRLQFSALDYRNLLCMYQMIHLQRELGLPFAEVDLLLMAILRAEGLQYNWHLSPATLRALGVFRYLKEAYGISAEQFAALILEVSPHAVGESTPMLDRVLNGPGSGQMAQVEVPLILDDRTFDPNDGADGQLKVLPALCVALGANEATTRDYLQQAQQALGLSTLTLSLPLFSSLYRLSRLHRLFKRSAVEGQALIRLLGQTGENLSAQLAGKPKISDQFAPDVLDMLVALSNLDQWLRQEQILPSALLGALTATDGAQLALDSKLVNAIYELIPEIRKALQAYSQPDWQRTASSEDALQTLAASLLIKAFGGSGKGVALEQQHIAPLLRWCATSAKALLEDVLKAAGKEDTEAPRLQTPLDASLWSKLARHCALIHLLRLSPGALQALCDHPQWFDLEEPEEVIEAAAASIPTVSLDQCYQLSRLRQWVEVCRRNGGDENDAILYLTQQAHSTAPTQVAAATEHLGTLLGWPSEQIQHACPHVKKITYVDNDRPTFDDYLTTLTKAENACFLKHDEGYLFRWFIYRNTGAWGLNDINLQRIIDKLAAFLESNPGPLLLTPEQYARGYQPDRWAKMGKEFESDSKRGYFPLELEALNNGTVQSVEWLPCVPTTISDIDFILRIKGPCERTGLSSEALLELSELQETSDYDEFQACSQLLLAGGDDTLREAVEPPMQEAWRDALVNYLLAHWVPASPLLKAHITGPDALSDYCLTDVAVSSQVNTTPLNQAIGSLQNYMFRLFAHLEPGYTAAPPSSYTIADWQARLGQYGTWKQRQEQYNHPENLIHYSNRPNKSVAFQELEVELNQGKLDTSLLHTAICNYLAKFERVSNLQVVSGYLEGSDPRQGVYHLIGKTNSTPPEYFWRTLDMGLRDDKQRLSPLAWSEWEKIGLSPTGKIPESYYEEKKDDKVVQKFTCDAIRPVIIEGRRYVFWVERGTTDLPSGDSSNKTLPKMRKISVHYAFQQSDGNWSTGNELMCLDGHDHQGKWGGDSNNAFLKDDTYIPGLIVVVDEEVCERKQDPWLVAMLYNCAGVLEIEEEGPAIEVLGLHERNDDYFLEARDLLLIEKKDLGNTEKTAAMVNTLFASYSNVHCIQHTYNGRPLKFEHILTTDHASNGDSLSALDAKARIIKEISAFTFSIKMGSQTGRSTTVKAGFTLPVDSGGSKSSDFKLKYMEAFVMGPKDEKFRSLGKFRIHSQNGLETTIPFECLDLGQYVFLVTFTPYQGGPLENIEYTFKLQETAKKDEKWDILIKRNANQAQYLDLTSVAREEPKLDTPVVRLNTLFGMNLVARASQGVEQVLAWATQCLQEPGIDKYRPNPKLDFHGANGLYFRELFLHLPALVATRLTEQRQFEEAEDWYQRYLFAPYRTGDDELGRPAPWCTRPLAEVGSLSSTLQQGVDPVSRVFVLSRYYQQAVYLSLLENWRLQGDHYYRQSSLSNLNHAWLCYQQALRLLGPLPRKDEASRWLPVVLAQVDAEQFRHPLNSRVIELRNLLESRLHNLRHGLSLDGKALPPLTWADESLDAFGSVQGGVSLMPQPYVRGRAPIPAYRFRQLLPLAKAAAQQLLDFGRHYMSLMEEEFNTSLSVQLKAQEIKLSEFALRLQREAISGIQLKKSGMLISREAAKAKHDYLSKLIDVGRSPEEEAATAFNWIANSAMLFSIPFQITAAAVDVSVPTIYGMAVGGNKLGAPMARTAMALEAVATASKMVSDELQTQAGYNRRAAEWEFDRSQVEWDIKVLDQQINETNIELNAATIALAQCEQERTNLREAYVSMTTGFTIIPIYNWLVARQEQIYGAAYDAVCSLCLGVEEAWRYEIGDYRRESFIDTTAWRDNYKGMLVGESLLTNLQHMENQYLLANERRLTIRKAFSLKEKKDWTTVFSKPDNNEQPKKDKPLTYTFGFKAADFDKSYPGHYLRQLKYVSVTFVLKAGSKLDDLSAILTQTASTTLLEADRDAAKVLRKGGKLEGITTLLRNPRQNQQIALSSTVAEDGLGYEPGTWVYELMFHDGRYLPFEGTGAISEWTLEILGGAALEDPSIIEDITFNMVYTAKAGDSAFTEEVRKLS